MKKIMPAKNRKIPQRNEQSMLRYLHQCTKRVNFQGHMRIKQHNIHGTSMEMAALVAVLTSGR